MPSRLPTALGALVAGCLLALTAGSASAATPGPSAGPTSAARVPPAVAAHAREVARVTSFWTPARVLSAVPVDVSLGGPGGTSSAGAVAPAATPSPVVAPRVAAPAATRARGGVVVVRGGRYKPVLGASWSAGGAAQTTVGKVLFFDAVAQQPFVCSGDVVVDGVTSRAVVATAAHCVTDAGTSRFFTNWIFVPDWDGSAATQLDLQRSFCSQTRFGCWVSAGAVVHTGWTSATAVDRFGNLTVQAVTHDWAFVVLGAGGRTGTAYADDVVGAQQVDFSGRSPLGRTVTALGYPAAPPFSGKDLRYCEGGTGTDANAGNLTLSLPCDMTGGSSGGPWLRDVDRTGRGVQISVNSYGYAGSAVMYGPVWNSRTAATYTTALSGSGNRTVSGG